MQAKVYAAPWLLTGAPPPAGALRDGAVALDRDRVIALGPRGQVEREHGAAEPLDAVVLPALVNAHLHLELSHLAGRVSGGDGLAAWIGRLLRLQADEAPGAGEGALARAVESLEGFGVAAVGDVSNTLASLSVLAWAGLSGTVFHEVYGFSAERAEEALRRAKAAREMAPTGPTQLAVALAPHAVYSTRPNTVARLLAAGRSTIHLAEDPGERLFCSAGEGPFADIARQLGAGQGDLAPVARSAVARVAPWLRPTTLAVHLVDLDEEDLRELARSGATAVLCPRSNLHIGGRLPDLPRLLAAGVPMAVGTDSLASTPSLSPLAELAALRRAFPAVEPVRLLPLAWNGAAVGVPGVGRLAPGLAPGIVAAPLDGARAEDPFAWLLEAFGAEERPLRWLAHHRPEAR